MIINQKHKRAIYILFLCSIIGILLFIGLLVSCIWKTKEYIPIEAVMISKNKESGRTVQNMHNIKKYVAYTYEYNGKEYTSWQRVFSFFGKKEGDLKVIHVNPLEPNETKDTFTFRMYIFLIVFCFIMAGLTGKAISLIK